jgi:predicted enzyme related to lactoylglutathione lyase
MPPERAASIHVSYLSMFTRDLAALPSFYVEVFGLQEVEASRSERYRELKAGELMLGFPAIDAYQRLDMADQAEPTGVRSMVTFAVDDQAAVDDLIGRALSRGARLVKPAFATDFGQYLAVLLDPEGNAIRIAAAVSAAPKARSLLRSSRLGPAV